MLDNRQRENGSNMAPDAPKEDGRRWRTALLLLGALAALIADYFLFFFSVLMIGFSFDAPGSHFADEGLWLRLLALWPPVSLLLVAVAALICIFRRSLRLLWIALGLFAGTIVLLLGVISAWG